MPLSAFHPLVRSWFTRRFGQPTLPQTRAWPEICAGRDVLVSAPTGSGKTLAAFLASLDALFRRGLSGTLPDLTAVLYVSPLKALSSDVRKNLQQPLSELEAEAESQGLLLPQILVGLRTGDTAPHERQAMARRPPHILVTTPESLYLCLTAEKMRNGLRAVRTVILDEVHAMLPDKRGAHLSLSLERLDALCREHGQPAPQRIGLSATVHPIAEVARFLVGAGRVRSPQSPADDPDGTADCVIVDGRPDTRRELDLRVCLPQQPLSSICSNEQWQDVHDQVADLIRNHQTTLVFVSTRRMCERTAHTLAERLGPDAVMAHHGSLSRGMRQRVEERLKRGELKAVVATASLELGIDIGAIDLVCQIGSPRAISTFLQRIGRANHRPGPDAVPRARLFAMTRDELVECAALVRAARAGELDRQVVPVAPQDVIAQQIVAICAAAGPEGVDESELLTLIRQAWPFRTLSDADYTALLLLLSEGVATRRGRPTAHIHWDRVNHRLRGRRGARLFATQNGGTIPEPNDFEVVLEGDEIVVGRLDEEFVVESSPGDIFLLGSTAWRLRGVRGGRAYVADANGATPTVPFWAGEAPGRTFELSRAVSRLRSEIQASLRGESDQASVASPTPALGPVQPWLFAVPMTAAPPLGPDANPGEPAVDPTLRQRLIDECGVPSDGAVQIIEYLRAGIAALGQLPTQKTLIAERFFDEGGGMQLVLHMPFGARQNRAFGLALRKRFCRAFNFELQAAATDEGILLSLGETHSFPLETVWQFLRSDSVRHVLSQAVLGAPIFQPHFRHVSTRALSLPRRRGGKKLPPPIVRVMTEDLLGAVFPHAAACPENLPGGDIEIPNHPLVSETLRECLQEVMDIERLEALLRDIESGAIAVSAADTAEPSPLSLQLIHAAPYAFLDDTPFEERRTRAVKTRPGALSAEDVLAHAPENGLDPQAVSAVREQAWPRMRDPDELHDALLTLYYLPQAQLSSCADLARPLLAGRRATLLRCGPLSALVASERVAAVRRLFSTLHQESATAYPDPVFDPEPPALSELRMDLSEVGADEYVTVEIVRGWLAVTGPWQVRGLAATLHLPVERVLAALLRLESEGMAMRGRFLPDHDAALQPVSTGGEAANESLQFCDRRLLAQIHRHTRKRLAREYTPATAAQYWQLLARWQHAWPGTQLVGPSGLLRVIEQLQGYILSAAAWEESVLPQRLRSYSTTWLDELCLSGEVAWGRLRPAQGEGRFSRVTPLSLWRRSDAEWLVPARPWQAAASAEGGGQLGAPAGLSAIAEAAWGALFRRGARFLTELSRDIDKPAQEVLDALGELAAAGLVTADGAAGLRLLVTHLNLKSARMAAGASLGAGRWSLLEGSAPIAQRSGPGWRGVEAVLGSEADWENPAILESWASLYLNRYGILVRELVLREPCGPPLSVLSRLLRRMEARGLVRSGYFVAGFSGEQFATPEALEGLKLIQKQPLQPSAPVEIAISAADPLNLTGVLFPGARVPVSSSARVLFRNGEPTGMISGAGGESPQITSLSQPSSAKL